MYRETCCVTPHQTSTPITKPRLSILWRRTRSLLSQNTPASRNRSREEVNNQASRNRAHNETQSIHTNTNTKTKTHTVTEKLMNGLLWIALSQAQDFLISKPAWTSFPDSEAVIEMNIIKVEGRRWDTCQEPPELRWIACLTESIWTPKSKSDMLTPKTNSQTCWRTAVSPSWTESSPPFVQHHEFFRCSLAISVQWKKTKTMSKRSIQERKPG